MEEANQSSFRLNDFCENQLRSISPKIHTGFDSNLSLDIRVNDLGFLKAFNRAWYEDLLYKLETLRISGNIFTLFQTFL